MAALREGNRLAQRLPKSYTNIQWSSICSRHFATTRTRSANAGVADIEEDSIEVSTMDPSLVENFRTEKRISTRDRQLPGNRYQFHPPKYDRGPLHPVQSPARSDPVARNFMAGPFNLPRLKQTYENTIASDIMTLAYQHVPPGTPKRSERERLRKWVGDSPYFENRQLRGPRGHSHLPLLEKDITAQTIPEIFAVHMNCYWPDSIHDRRQLQVTRSVIQSISGRVPRLLWVKNATPGWRTKEGRDAGCKVTIFGDQAYEFLDKTVNLVFPKIKDWEGLKGGGDGSGNIAFGLTPSQMAMYPEIEGSFDMYPQKTIPGCNFYIETTAKSDRQARLLLTAMGFPFVDDAFN